MPQSALRLGTQSEDVIGRHHKAIQKRCHEIGEATKQNMINIKRNTEEKSTWKNQKEKLRTAFPELTDEDLNFGADRKSEMLGKLAIKLGKTTPELATVLEKA